MLVVKVAIADSKDVYIVPQHGQRLIWMESKEHEAENNKDQYRYRDSQFRV